MRDYTSEEMQFLATLEKHFESAVYGHWYRNIDRRDGERMHEIHKNATGWNARLNTTCGACMLELTTAVGEKYYAQKTRKVAKVEKVDMPKAKAEKRVKVQTRKRANNTKIAQ